MRGNFGRPGAGICPVRGHSNVQGDRTVGIDEKPSAELLGQIEKVFGFRPPQHHGRSVVDSLQAMIDGASDVFIGLGGNFIAAVPDAEIVKAAMRRLKLTVAYQHQAQSRPCGAWPGGADPALPGQKRHRYPGDRPAEHHGRRQHVDGACLGRPGGTAQPAPQVRSVDRVRHGARDACRTARSTGTAFEADYDLIRDKIEAVFPKLFADFNTRIRHPGRLSSLQWPAKPGMEDGDGTRELPGLRWRRGRSRR